MKPARRPDPEHQQPQNYPADQQQVAQTLLVLSLLNPGDAHQEWQGRQPEGQEHAVAEDARLHEGEQPVVDHGHDLQPVDVLLDVEYRRVDGLHALRLGVRVEGMGLDLRQAQHQQVGDKEVDREVRAESPGQLVEDGHSLEAVCEDDLPGLRNLHRTLITVERPTPSKNPDVPRMVS